MMRFEYWDIQPSWEPWRQNYYHKCNAVLATLEHKWPNIKSFMDSVHTYCVYQVHVQKDPSYQDPLDWTVTWYESRNGEGHSIISLDHLRSLVIIFTKSELKGYKVQGPASLVRL